VKPRPRRPVTRRGLLGRAAALLAGAGLLARGRRARAEEELPFLETPSDDEGPFYREGAPARTDLRVEGSRNAPLTLLGVVRAEDGKPLADVRLDLWHADAAGAYDMESPAFRHRGTLTTDAEGRYRFTTNLPGRYGFRDGSARPRHVHVKLSGKGLYDLTTQAYFGVRPGVDVTEELCPSVTWTGRGPTRAGKGIWDLVLSRRRP
jgi:protocatechuate 3,4-dioxygenase beta subunit